MSRAIDIVRKVAPRTRESLFSASGATTAANTTRTATTIATSQSNVRQRERGRDTRDGTLSDACSGRYSGA